MVAVVVVAAGKGTRMETDVPKQYARFPDGKMILRHVLDQIAPLPDLKCIQVVIAQSDFALYESAVQGFDKSLLLPPVFGQDTRQQSVFQGLVGIEARHPTCKTVVIHDAARPFADTNLFQDVLRPVVSGESLAVYGAVPVIDTLRMIGSDEGIAGDTLSRSCVHAVQTPQAFAFEPLIDAHISAQKQGLLDMSDDIAIMQQAGYTVHYVAGNPVNFKITMPEDLQRATSVLRVIKRDKQVLAHA